MKKSTVIFLLILAAVLLAAGAVIFCVLYGAYPEENAFLVLYVTFMTTFYHFVMRLAVGETVTLVFRHRTFDYDAAWFRARRFEEKLFRFLRVKSWKTSLITAKPEQFDLKNVGLGGLLFYVTQAEVVHEVIIVLSFAPVLLSLRYGEAAIFLITSFAAALIDLVFVIIQRYNRPRIMKLIGLKNIFRERKKNGIQ